MGWLSDTWEFFHDNSGEDEFDGDPDLDEFNDALDVEEEDRAAEWSGWSDLDNFSEDVDD